MRPIIDVHPSISLRGLLTMTMTAALLTVVFSSTADSAAGQDRANGVDVASSFGGAHGATLKWFDRYLRNTVILTKEDVAKVREKIALMSPSQLEQWIEQTEQLRATIESDSWQKTKKWLRDFLRVQAIYSDEEIDELHTKILNATPDELVQIMENIHDKHRSMTSMHRASDANRKASMKSRDQYVKSSAAAATTARKSSSSNRPLFGNTQGHASQRYKSYKQSSVPRPLITSREVAADAVRREVYPGRGRWGW